MGKMVFRITSYNVCYTKLLRAILEKLDTYEEREIFMDLIDKIVTGFVTPIES